MSRVSIAALATIGLLLLLAAPGRAVTITEFEIEPGAPSGAHAPRYIDAGSDGNLWFAQTGIAPGIGRVTPSGQMLGVIPEPRRPVDVIHGPDGTVYWAGEDGIGRRTPGGTIESYDADSGENLYTLALNTSNQLLWTGQRESLANEICRFEFNVWGENEVCETGGKYVFSRITGLAPVGDGSFWAAVYEANEVRRVSSVGSGILNLELPGGSGPARIAMGPDGRAWVTMYDADAIDSFLIDGARQRFPLPSGTGPNDIAFGPDGALWFTGFKSNAIGRMTTSGAVTLYPLPTPNAQPVGIAAGADGNIWFTESAAGKIGRLVPDSAAGSGDTTAPSFTQAPKFAPKRFAVAGKGKGPKGVPKGSKLNLALSEPATVIATIARKLPGRRAGKRCVAPGKAKAKANRCTRFVTRGTLSKALPAGAGSIAFNGKLKGRALKPGAYRATVSAQDAAGNLSAARFAGFTIAG